MSDELVNAGMPSQIVPMILWRMQETLAITLIYEVPETNPTRAVEVKIGRFLESPAKINVSVSISPGDFEEPRFMDGPINLSDLQEYRPLTNLPVGEIGGGCYWWRRGSIRFQAFFVRQNYPERTAMEYAYDFYGRLLKNIGLIPVGDLKDDYGEGALNPLYLEGSSFFEAGGKDKYIWTGKLLFRVLTWRP